MCTRNGSQPRVWLSIDKMETKCSSAGKSKVRGPKTSSEIRWMAFSWQNLKAVFELRSSEAVASQIVRVREHERFHWASSVLKCRFEFAQKEG